jgi:hypothetical protein
VPSPDELLERMRRRKNGWHPKDFRRLYTAWGFVYEERSKHTMYWHPQHPELVTTVARSDPLAVGYADTGVKLIDALKRLEAGS